MLYPIAFCLFYLLVLSLQLVLPITRPCSTWNLGQVSTSDANETHGRRISFTLCSRLHLHRPGWHVWKSNSVLNNSLPNNTQITTNDISYLLCRSRPLRFIEDQLSLKDGIVKNASQNTSGKMSGVWDTYLQQTLGGQEKPLQKTH